MLLLILVSGSLLSGLLARSRGASFWLFASLGSVLGLAGLSLTWFATQERPWRRPPRALGLSPTSPLEPEPERDTDELEAWSAYYDGFSQGLVLLGVGLAGSLTVMLALAVVWVLPTFVALFEGMSLALPWPTRLLIALTHVLRDPAKLVGLNLLTGVLVPLGYRGLLRAPYGMPLLGEVWRRSDRLWACYSARAGVPSALPGVVGRRLAGLDLEPCDPAQERDRLAGALWSCLLALVPAVVVATLGTVMLLLGLWLPFNSPLLGNIGE